MIAARRLLTRGWSSWAWVLVLLVAAPAAAQGPEVPIGEHWLRVRTEHFQLLGNADSRKTVEIGQRLERFREVLARLKPGLRLAAPIPTSILIFKNDRSFSPYKQAQSSAGSELVGFFLSHSFGNVIAVNAYPPSGNGLEVVFHEYTHFFVRHNFPHLPLWANEGLAEYYSSFEQLGSEIVIGAPIARHLESLRRQSFIPLERLFAVTSESPEYNERDRKGLFYSESWALMHLLISGLSEREAPAARFLAELTAGRPAAEAAEKALGFSLAELEVRLRGYLNGRRFPTVKLDAQLLPPLAEPSVEEAAESEAWVSLGDLLARGKETPENLERAAEHYRAALARDPASAEAKVGLAWVARRGGRRAEAEKLLSEAVAGPLRSPVGYVLYAQAVLERLREEGPPEPDQPPPAELGPVRQALAKARALDPDFGELEATLGQSYFLEPARGEEGVGHLERACELLPDRPDLLYNLAMLHLNAGKTDLAAQVIDGRLRATGREDLIASATEALTRTRYLTTGNRAVEAGKLDEALAAYRAAMAATSDPLVRSQIEETVVGLERQIETQDQVANYNRAVDLANRGESRQALELLEKLQPDVTDDRLSVEIEVLIDRLREAAASRPR